MPLPVGTRLGPYDVVGVLGAGGMGEVYRARDTRLDRTVAIKILPEQLSSDPLHRQRFEREAKTVSNLNHPHICVLYDVGHQDGIDYLVMECVEGETLAKRLEKGPLPLDQVLKYGAQLADALDRAHRAGIVHRDLKPGNVMLAKNGAKLMDFGLAKASAGVSGSQAPAPLFSAAVTMTSQGPQVSPQTTAGTIIGTMQYMSPEQLQGMPADARSDLFALGAVLYEMVTGKRAFEGKSQLSVATAILEKDPEPISAAKPVTPPALEHAIRRCLAKDPDQRWQTARDLSEELTWISETAAQPAAAPRPTVATGLRAILPWAVVAVLLVALIATAIWWPKSRAEETMYFHSPLPFPARDVALSPNGLTLAVVGYLESARRNAIWIYDLGSRGAKNLPETEGASYPFWSPDGKSLAFFSDAKLRKLDLAGGPVQTICDAPSGRGGSWNSDGVIIFSPDVTDGLYQVSASGGSRTAITKPDTERGETSHRWPLFLPDGVHYLYLGADFTWKKRIDGIFMGALGSTEKRLIVEAGSNPAYAAPGYLLYYRDKGLFAQPFDLKQLKVSGEPSLVLSDVQFLPQVKRAVFAVSDAGSLVAQGGSQTVISQPTWFDRKGNPVGTVGRPDVYGNVFVAPNGKSVALDYTDMASLNTDIWTYELQRDASKRLTFDPAIDGVPVWSPDASRIVFGSNRLGGFNLYVKNSDGAEEESALVTDGLAKWPNDWSRDGKYILYGRGPDLWFVTLPDHKTSQFLKAVSVIRNGQFSPDGKWVAYASNETGKWEIYVTSFPEARGKWQISAGGGEQPRWRGDGKELFYLSLDAKIMAAPVKEGTSFDPGAGVPLFQATPRPPIIVYDLFVYDVSRDGQRFLINTPVKQTDAQPMSVVLNWAAAMRK